jgi:hypothetical protein
MARRAPQLAPSGSYNENDDDKHAYGGKRWEYNSIKLMHSHKNHLRGYQASARGGKIQIELKGKRVYLGGNAVTITQGEFISLS